MNFETPNPEASSDIENTHNKKGSIKSTLIKTGQIAVAASAIFTGVGCEPSTQHPDNSSVSDKDFIKAAEQVFENLKASEAKSEKALLNNYNMHIESGDPTKITKEESRTRAIEIIHAMKMRVGSNKVEFETKLGIPVKITVGDVPVPIGYHTYSAFERKLLGL